MTLGEIVSIYGFNSDEANQYSARPTAAMLAERDKRESTPRSIVSWLMGDPPPGYSALDKRDNDRSNHV